MQDVAKLSYHELVVDRPFTDPDHIAADSDILLTAAKTTWRIVEQSSLSSGIISPHTIYYPEAEQWQKRTMLFNPSMMLTAASLAVVGFFGNKRAYMDAKTESSVVEVGHQLCQSLDDNSGIVCYVSKLLADAYNYANLVVMTSDKMIEEWRKNEIHRWGTALISPKYYHNVCIYNATLSISHHPLQLSLNLTRVKYFDYSGLETWYGVRQLSESPAIPSIANSPTLMDQEYLQ